MRLYGIILICAAATLTGCAGTMPGPGQPMPGVIFTATTTPGTISMDAEYLANPGDFEILGLAEGTSSNMSILGLFSTGNGGYIAAIENAVASVGADGLINCVGDVKTTSILGLFSSSKCIVRGLAIKKK